MNKHELIPTARILLGGENDVDGFKYALHSGDLRRPSTLASNGPHANLLQSYSEIGDEIFSPEVFPQTAYYKNARYCIDFFGEYFPDCRTYEEVVAFARHFVAMCNNGFESRYSSPNEPPIVIRIPDSEYFQIVQGNHRIAIEIAKKRDFIICQVLPGFSHYTPAQFLLNNISWDSGDRILYQPLPAPELQNTYTLARKCEDRLMKIIELLNIMGIRNQKDHTIIDLGSYYGYFVEMLVRSGYNTLGIEIDRVAISLGNIFYKNTLNRITHGSITSLLINDQQQKFDIVLCLSIMHHCLTRRFSLDILSFAKGLDKITSHCLLLEMATESEKWFSNLLKGWNQETIIEFMLENTSFSECANLGYDSDSCGQFSGNFNRPMLAFFK